MEYRNPKDLQPHPTSVALYGDNHIDDLLESIRNYGILVPLTITDKNMIISGHRRWRSAITLALEQVPVVVTTFPDEWAEKRAILDFNKQREKTFSQKMNEAQLIKDIATEDARRRQATSTGGKNPQLKENYPKAEGQARDIVAEKIGIGSGRTFDKAEKIWGKAKEGDENAQQWVGKLDKDEED